MGEPSAVKPLDPEVIEACVCLLSVLWVAIIFVGCLPRVAKIFSTAALTVSSGAFLGLQQSEGGIFDSCYGYTFFDVNFEQCQAIAANIFKDGQAQRGWLAMAISKARGENCLAFGMGVGALYSLLFLTKGTKEVAVVHLMHAAWAVSVTVANAQNAGLLPDVSAEFGVDAASSKKLRPFVLVTGVQAFLAVTAFLLSVKVDLPAGGGWRNAARKEKKT